MMTLHESLQPLEFLIGTWAGSGMGAYPTISDFRYREELTFGHSGKAFLAYTQKTWTVDTSQPMHTETGYWRMDGEHRLEVMICHPFGVVELTEGSVNGVAIELASSSIGLSRTAKQITDIRRTYLVAGDLLTYEIRMQAVGEPLDFHLAAELRREPAS